MGSRQYLIPTDAMTLADQQGLRTNALAAGIQRCFEKGIGTWDKREIPTPDPKNPTRPDFRAVVQYLKNNNWPASLDVREFQPIIDAGAAAGDDYWYTAPLTVEGSTFSCLGAVGTAPIQNRANKLVVFYKVSVISASFPVNRLIFRNNANGNLLAQFDLQQLEPMKTPEGYFSEPFVIDPNMTFAVQVLTKAAPGDSIEVFLGNFVFEPTGQTNA